MESPLPLPCLCLVTDRKVGDPRTLVDRVARAVSGGVDMVQLREKDLPGGELLKLAVHIKRALQGRALLVINERADVALAAEADGVHLGEEALPLEAVRRVVGPQVVIGRSVHSPEAAALARDEGAQLLIVGTMYATRSHPGAVPEGPGLIKTILERQQSPPGRWATSPPLIGIGGITADNLGEVMQAGASGVAVISSILAAEDPERAAQQLKQAMLEAWQGGAALPAGDSRGGPVAGGPD